MSRLEEDEGTYDIIEHSPCAVNQHSIILIKKKLNDDDRFCEVCKGLILGPFYSCDQCHLFVHETCRKLPKKMQVHRCRLTLLDKAPSPDGAFCCAAC